MPLMPPPWHRVLVVDDDAAVREMVRLTLTKAELEVVEAEDGEQAIKEIIQSIGGDHQIDAIFCGTHIRMANGEKTIAYCRSDFPSYELVAMTEPLVLQEEKALYKQGVSCILVKPIDAGKIMALVEKMRQQRSGGNPWPCPES